MDGLKQRIIGALVLVSLAVIFVPMIFDEPHSERQSTPITIPEEPPFPEVDMPQAPVQEEPRYLENTDGSDSSSSPSAAAGSADYRIIETDESSNPAASPEAAAPVEAPQSSAAAPAESSPASPAAPSSNTESTGDSSSVAETADGQGSAEFTRSLEGAWVVQLGSFGNEDNARRLRDRVIEMGYGAHLQQVTRGGQTLTRVFSGPFVNKADAEKAKAALDSAFSLNGLVTSGDK